MSIRETEMVFPATNGIVLTSGNLRDITIESGPMTSISVAKKSFLKGGVTMRRMQASTRYAVELEAQVQQSLWSESVRGTDGMQRSRAEGGAKWDWQTGGGSPWLTIFGPGDCTNLQSECRGDNVDRALKLNVSDGGHVRISFEVLDNTETVSQIVFPVSWGIREGYSSAHSYRKSPEELSRSICATQVRS